MPQVAREVNGVWDVRTLEVVPPNKGWMPYSVGEKPNPGEGQTVENAGVVVEKGKAKRQWKLVDKPKDRMGDTLLTAFDKGEATPQEMQRAVAWLLRQARPVKTEK